MACERPKKIVNPRYKGLSKVEIQRVALEKYYIVSDEPPDYYISVPCGRCQNCQKRRLQSYRFRIYHELKSHPASLFVTLSFTDDALEEYKENLNKAVCQFMDAMRKEYGKEIKHFFVLEYGDVNGRPHYHGLLFGVPHLDFFKVESIWNRGNGKIRNSEIPFEGFYFKPRGIIYLEYVREPEKCASYICKYLTKEYSPDRKTPRVLTSIGIGKSYLDTLDAKLNKYNLDTTITWFGYPFQLPRYYTDKIFDKEDKRMITIVRMLDPKQVWYLNGREYYSQESYDLAMASYHKYKQTLGLSPSDKYTPEPRKRKQSYLSDSWIDNIDFNTDYLTEEPF